MTKLGQLFKDRLKRIKANPLSRDIPLAVLFQISKGNTFPACYMSKLIKCSGLTYTEVIAAIKQDLESMP